MIKKLLSGATLLFATSVAFATSAFCPSLADEMDEFYGAGNWTYRTGSGQGSDIAPAIYSAIAKAHQVCIGAGQWALKTSLDPIRISGASIRGVTSQISVITYQQNTGAAFWMSGDGGKTGGGISHLAILLEDGYGDSGAVAIKLQGDHLYQPDQLELSDLYVSARGQSYWNSAFYANGTARTHPQGIRVVDIRNVQLFRAHQLGVWISGAIQWTVSNIGVYVGKNTGENFYLAGGGTPETNSAQFYMTGAAISGQLNITNISKFDISASCSTIATMWNAEIGRIHTMGCTQIGAFGPKVGVTN